ncbi:MAG: hypothetical protein JWN14_2283, partial [Chthonomonadales bacterium]|nr:hypothetical protein [Chthonomonadales bacterium]
RSYSLVPLAQPAFVLGVLFDTVNFRETAHYWFEKAEQAAKLFPTQEIEKEVLRQLQECKSAGPVSDPDISSYRTFPNHDTPGLKPIDAQERLRREEQKRREEAEMQKQMERTKQGEAERQKQLAERKQKEEDEREIEQKRRIRAGLCIVCEKPLGFFENLTNKQAHGKCSVR